MSANNPPPAPTEGFLVIGYLKKLVSWMKKNRPIAGPGILAKQTEGGIVFSTAPSQSDGNLNWDISTGTGLTAIVSEGSVIYWDTDNLVMSQETNPETEVSLTGSTTNYIYYKTTLRPLAWGSYYVAWVPSAGSCVAQTTAGTNTVDFDNALGGGGDYYQLLGTAVTSGTAILAGTGGIDQLYSEAINFNFLTMSFGAFSCGTA